MLIGMLHNRKDPNKVSRAYLYSAIANQEKVGFFYFTTKGVDFKNKLIKGKYYEQGIWKDKTFPFPDVVINSANQKTKTQKQIYYKLETMIPYTSYPVGSKTFVYSKLKKSKYLEQFLIPYKVVKNNTDILLFLSKYNKVIVKPVRGHHGDNVVKIEEKNDYFEVIEKDNIYQFDLIKLIDYLDNLPKNKVVQKFIDSSISSGEPFDFRLHLQKGKNGEWNITIIVPRIGSKNRVITNISQGSQMMEFIKFLRKEYRGDARNIQKQIETFAIDFTYEFEKQYPYNFDELGIDIGFDKDKNIWVYEVNWRPGQIFIEVITARNAINYAIYLAKERRNENAKN